MKKGLISIDVLIALVVLIFIVTWLEGFSTNRLLDVNSFGVQAQTNSLATGLGTQINAFYALDPGAQDYLDLSDSIVEGHNISDNAPIVPQTSKSGNLFTVIMEDADAYYPVTTSLSYNPSTKKVTP